MDIILRTDQKDFKAGIITDWNKGYQNVLGIMPTGGGKSVVVSDIILDGAMLGMTQGVIAHRNELVGQMSLHVANRGIPHRIIGSAAAVAQITRAHRDHFSGRSFINPSARTAVIGVDTLMARSKDLINWGQQLDRWVIDEAHHVIEDNKWGKAVKMFPNAHGLGVTATGIRADGQGLGRQYDGVFDSLVIGPSMRELINWGALSDYEIVCPKSDLEVNDSDLSAGGDYSPQKLKQAADKSHIVGDVVEAYARYAFGKRAICFATDVETANKIAQKFNAVGIRAASLSAKTPFNIREKYVKEFKSGKLWILVNVDLFDEGFDVPACEVVIMARPTASFGKYSQMVGRALRAAPGKLYGLIIDHVSNVTRHGLPDKPKAWTLSRRDKRGKNDKDPDDIPLTSCLNPDCGKPYERFYAACPYCGFAKPLPVARERTVEMVEGDLVLLDRATLEKMRQAALVESPADLGERVALAAGEFAAKGAMIKQIEKIEAHRRLSTAIAKWAAVERLKGRTDSQAYRIFYLTTGMDVMAALDGTRTRQEFEEMAIRIEGWYL